MMCEDAEWAVRVLSAGATIAYVAEARVAHSHCYTLRSVMSRNFDYAVSLDGLPGSMGARSYLRYLREELAFVLAHGGATRLPEMAGFEAARAAGYLLGTRSRSLPAWCCRRISGYPHWFDPAVRWHERTISHS